MRVAFCSIWTFLNLVGSDKRVSHSPSPNFKFCPGLLNCSNSILNNK
uniref:Uncharacterized protein n=1 Tax=Arundo donax TaxID=35708 RepID=A0A0A9GQZ7_ARUDO